MAEDCGGVGRREKGLDRAEFVKGGMFSVPEEGMRSRTEDREGCRGCRKGRALAVLVWASPAEPGWELSHPGHDQSALDKIS